MSDSTQRPKITLKNLSSIVDEDGQPVKIIQKIAAGKYKDFGMHLLDDENMTEVDVLEKHHIHEGPVGITKAIIKEWLVSGSTPRTHKHLIDCIRKCGLGALAEDMENALSGISFLRQLLEELKDVDNWFVLGIFLGVPVKQLQEIESSHRGEVEGCMIAMLKYWLNKNVTPSWKDVVRALEQTNQLVLAATVKQKYLLSTTVDEGDGLVRASEELSAVITSSAAKQSTSLLLPQPPSTSSSPPTSEEIAAEIKADVAVVKELQELENFFYATLVRVKRCLKKLNCALSDARQFLNGVTGTRDFNSCDSFDKLMEKLQQDHIDVFNTSRLQGLVACFDEDELTKLVDLYEEKKQSFLKNTTVFSFQRAVVSKVERVLPKGKATVTIKVLEKKTSLQTLKDIEDLALKGFEDCYKSFVQLHAKRSSIIISWVFPKALSGNLVDLACKNEAVFKEAGVEVTVDGRRVYPVTQQEVIIKPSQDADLGKKENSLKQVYTEFYHVLVDAISDSQTCQSLTAQLHSTTLISQEKIAQLCSGQTSGSEFLKVLGVEEETRLITMLMEKMAGVEQLQTVAELMAARLSELLQGAADTEYTSKPAQLDTTVETKQLQARIDQLAKDKKELFTRLQCCEEERKRVTELSVMRDKAISGMKAEARKNRDTDVERMKENSELKKRISQLEDEVTRLQQKQDSYRDIGVQTMELRLLPVGQKSPHTHFSDIKTQQQSPKEPQSPSQYLRSLRPRTPSESKIINEIGNITELSDPRGLAVTEKGHLIVVEDGIDCITIIDTSNKKKIRSFGQRGSGQVQFWYSDGVALTQDGNIVVADTSNHRLQVLTVEGMFVSEVGSHGSHQLQFVLPYDVAVHHDGKLFVTDSFNSRVQVLNSDLTFSHCFGGRGSPDKFIRPRGIAIDSDGMVYVADFNRVRKFTPEGDILAVIDSKGEGEGRLYDPYGLCVDNNDVLYVTEYDSNTVCMFSTNGDFLGYVGNRDGSSFKQPRFITSDQCGGLYISEWNKVTIYKH